MKLKLEKVIEVLCLNTLAIIIMTSADYQMSLGETTVSNTTLIDPNGIQQTLEAPIIPFTIPSNNQDEASGPANTGVDGSSNSEEKQANDAIVLLSQRYVSGDVFDKIVGEVLNNGNATVEFVKVNASFYHDVEAILGSEMTYAYPSTINPGDKSPFNIFITSGMVLQTMQKHMSSLSNGGTSMELINVF